MLGFNFIGNTLLKGFDIVCNVNNTSIKIVGVGEKFTEMQTLITNYFGGVTGGMGFGKGAVDTMDAVMCQDGLCAAVSVIGCVADGVQMVGAIVPGPNITMVITAPISLGCKTFVWCCKRAKFPWSMC